MSRAIKEGMFSYMMKMRQRDRQGIPARFWSVSSAFLILAGVAGFPAGLCAQDAASPAPASSPPPATVAPQPSEAAADAATMTVAPVAATLDTMSALNDEAKLGDGDRVSYRVVEEQKDALPYTVSDSGELDLPLVGRISAKGKTCKQLAYEIKPLLEKEYFYHATVIIGVETFSTRSKGTVYLEGQVLKQGAVEIPSDETLTVSKAILLDGGLGDFADRRKVKLIHKKADGTTETTIVDLVEILDKGHTEKDPVLQPDDMIIVPQRLVNF
jgi:polysaccharide export outer membrane protein